MSLAKRPNLDQQKTRCQEFLLQYRQNRRLKYVDIMQEVANRHSHTVEIEMDDLVNYLGDDEFAKEIENNTMRYVKLFAETIDEIKPDPDMHESVDDDVIDCLIASRQEAATAREVNHPNVLPDPKTGIPKELLRRFEVRIIPRSLSKPLKVRSIGAAHVGSSITVQGIVTRVTDVRPLMRVATYVCDVCGNEIYQSINKKQYTPLVQCPSEECQRNRNRRPIMSMTRGSKFEKFQEIKLQESPEEVPEGNVPRSITVYVMGECTRHCACGDKVTITGVWLPIPFSGGYRSMRSGLTSSTYLHCMAIKKEKKGYEMSQQEEAILEEVEEISRDPQIYSKLARSIAPEIYGLEDVKKALLLLLVAGVTTTQKDGMKIRGDINILLMGDPGVAKSQLLKHITTVAPRCVYTTGKGSSGVGLTAAVIRDSVTRDMVLEGGALVLSDMGICCIDEFDKMEEADRTAIHEVMEQQTISIAKAGITTTLNARTAILAAANPAFGRYDVTKKPEHNINLPAALLSRFDLVFVMVDKPDQSADQALALHIAYVHQHNTHPKLDFQPFSSDLLRAYITKARQYDPVIPYDLTQFIINCYVTMRKESLDEHGQYDSRKIVGTPRALLSILRLSQALARLRFSNEVSQADVEEAIRLIKEAKRSTLPPEEQTMDKEDVLSQIYTAIKTYLQNRDGEARISNLKTMLITRGFKDTDIEQTLERYEEDDVWAISVDRQMLHLVDID